jgi:hypothetical protein
MNIDNISKAIVFIVHKHCVSSNGEGAGTANTSHVLHTLTLEGNTVSKYEATEEKGPFFSYSRY